MSIFHRFIINISWNVLGKVCVLIISFVLSVLITRYLGKNLLGVYATVLTIPAFARLFGSFGLEAVLNKYFPKLLVKDPTQKQARFLLKRLILCRFLTALVFGFLLYLMLPAYLDLIHKPEILFYRTPIVLYFFATTLNSIISILFMTRLQYKITSAMETVNVILNLSILGLVIYFNQGLAGVLYAYIFSTGVTIAIYFYLANADLQGDTEKAELKEIWHFAWVAYLTSIFSLTLLRLTDIFLMNLFDVGNDHIAYYHLAIAVSSMLGFALTGVGPMALSIFSDVFTRESYTGLSKAWYQIVGITIICTTPIYVFVGFNAESLITFIYGDQFAGAGKALSIYLPFTIAFMFLGGGFAVLTLYVLEKKKIALRTTIEGCALNIMLNLILIPRYQEVGALIATGTTMVYMALRQFYHIRKVIEVRPVLLLAGKCFLLSLLALAPSVVLAKVWMDHLILNFVTYAITFLSILSWVKPLTPDDSRFIGTIFPPLEKWVRFFEK